MTTRPVGRQHRQRITGRRVISNQEWGQYLARSPQTFKKYLRAYEDEGNTYEALDIFSVLQLHKWLVIKRLEEAKQGMPNGGGLADFSLWGGQGERRTNSTNNG
jgi:hypothetical protein